MHACSINGLINDVHLVYDILQTDKLKLVPNKPHTAS